MHHKPEISLAGLKQRFLDIRDVVAEALQEIEESEAVRVAQWRCNACSEVKQFVQPVDSTLCGTCPICGSEDFTPVL